MERIERNILTQMDDRPEHNRVPIYSWAAPLDSNTLDQAINMANLPFAHHHVALMPDAHLGYGMPIGGVLATDGVSIPNAVGVDIGCGMAFKRTGIHVDEFNKHIHQVVQYVKSDIPLGFNKHAIPCHDDDMPEGYGDMNIVDEHWDNAKLQMGTLGGGNHFIEFQKDEEDIVCVMIHSGSRNLGKQVADYYNKRAIHLNERWYSDVDPKMQLSFLPLDSEDGMGYWEEMIFCVEYAKLNRKTMMGDVINAMNNLCLSVGDTDIIDVAHNYAQLEHHYGKNVMVHRKGATSAYSGEVGIIPGSQGTSSYIVEGLGSIESFKSCSHGAGRKMGRKQAIKELDYKVESEALNKLGILHSVHSAKQLDEAPSAYKDIDEVMANQTDLVEIVQKLTPLAVIKG